MRTENMSNIKITIYESNAVECIGFASDLSDRSLARSILVIPNGVTSIGDYAFCKCTSLKRVIIPDGVTKIGEDAFAGCIELESITIPNSVTAIEDGAFYGCSSLTSITIPDSVKFIGNNAFCGCAIKERG